MAIQKIVDDMRTTTVLDATKLSGAVPTGSLGNAPATDLSQLEMNQALLAFKIAAQNSLARFQMVDQVIDEYHDTTGIDAGNSTNEGHGGSGTAKYYSGSVSTTPTVTGGIITTDGDYTIHTFLANGSYVTDMAQTVDWLVVAGGGSGGAPDYSGGGGAGGLRTSYGSASGGGGSVEADASLSAATYTVVVGDGGTAVASGTNNAAGQGHDSSFIGTGVSITSLGGGRSNYNQDGSAGGSGGGGGREGGAGNGDGGAGTANQGYAGGSSCVGSVYGGGSGGGGAGSVGENAPTNNSRAGHGGAGLTIGIRGTVTVTPSAASEYKSVGHTSYNVGSGTVVFTTTDKSIRSSNALSGDFTLQVTMSGTPSHGHWIGVFKAAELSTFSSGHELGNLGGMTESYLFASASRASQTAGFMKGGNNSLQAYSSSTGDVIKIQRVGSTITNYLNGTLKHTQNSVSTDDMFVLLGGGGSGNSNYSAITWTSATASYAGGGGGARHSGTTGIGGGGSGQPSGGGGVGEVNGGNGSDGAPNTGGGGGGTRSQSGSPPSTTGGSGIVVIRRPTSASSFGDLTLQSVATTAASAPTTGDLVVLIDDGGSGTSAVQTNIKGFISRNGNFNTINTDHKQVTFVDEGTWGTTKQKILVARNVDLSGITTGTTMKYRLTTHAQAAGTMETRIHATSLAWA